MVKVRNSLGVLNSNRSGATGSWDVWGKILAETLWYLAYWYVLIFSSVQLLAQSCPTLRAPMDCSLPGSSVHGIFQARVLDWGAIAFSVRIETVSFLSLVRNNNIILVGKADQFWQPWWERWILHLPRLEAGGASLERVLNRCTWVRQEALGSHTPVTTGQAGLGALPLSFWSPRALAAWSVCGLWLFRNTVFLPRPRVARRPGFGEGWGGLAGELMLCSELSGSQAAWLFQAGRCPCPCWGWGASPCSSQREVGGRRPLCRHCRNM